MSLWSKITNIFTGSSQTILALNQRLNELQQTNETLQQSIKSMETKTETLAGELNQYKAKEEEDKQRQNSKEPWVEIKSADNTIGEDGSNSIKIDLDWNDAFIEYLKSNGITGPNDDTIVQKWLSLLYQDIALQLEQRAIRDTSEGTVNDIIAG